MNGGTIKANGGTIFSNDGKITFNRETFYAFSTLKWNNKWLHIQEDNNAGGKSEMTQSNLFKMVF